MNSLKFLSIGCNRIAGCGDWNNENGIFAYCGNKSVILFKVEV